MYLSPYITSSNRMHTRLARWREARMGWFVLESHLAPQAMRRQELVKHVYFGMYAKHSDERKTGCWKHDVRSTCPQCHSSGALF